MTFGPRAPRRRSLRAGHHGRVPYTVVSFHAHPDDEVLMTGGTLARAADEGHRVILVTATAGGAGLASTSTTGAGDLAERRMEELRRAAALLGIREVHLLGFDDSGMDGRAGRAGRAFAHVDVEEAATALAAVLKEVGADAITVYDPAGGYGHLDHVQVNRVGVRAAQLAGTPVVLEATVDRRPLLRILRILHLLRLSPPDWHPDRFAGAYAAPSRLTHRIDVRRYSTHKRAAMAAHASQSTADSGVRALAVFLRLPPFVFRRAFGHEWFVEVGRPRPAELLGDVFHTLRAADLGSRMR
jgi:LmbE family N-acetylglucosaminyl deacetylase